MPRTRIQVPTTVRHLFTLLPSIPPFPLANFLKMKINHDQILAERKVARNQISAKNEERLVENKEKLAETTLQRDREARTFKTTIEAKY